MDHDYLNFARAVIEFSFVRPEFLNKEAVLVYLNKQIEDFVTKQGINSLVDYDDVSTFVHEIQKTLLGIKPEYIGEDKGQLRFTYQDLDIHLCEEITDLIGKMFNITVKYNE
jgi:hypothetical protein